MLPKHHTDGEGRESQLSWRRIITSERRVRTRSDWLLLFALTLSTSVAPPNRFKGGALGVTLL